MVIAERSASLPARPDEAVARLAAAQYGVFSRAQAIESGASKASIQHRLAHARWESMHPGVYRIAGTPASWAQGLMAGCLAAGPDAVVSHGPAARLWQLSRTMGKAPLEVTVRRGRSRHVAGVVVHATRHLEKVDTAIVDRIPVTAPARTLIDCAAFLDCPDLEEALDEALRRGLLSIARLRWRMRALCGPGRQGSATLRRLVDARSGNDPLPESPLERRFLRLLQVAGLPSPVCQHEIRVRGRLIARVDFAYPDDLLAIEVDGYRYHSGRVRWQRDISRRNALTSLGWRVIHVTSEDVDARGEEICTLIAGALADGRLV